MVKREGLIVLCLFLLAISFVNAVDIEGAKNTVEDVHDTIYDEQARSDFFQSKWSEAVNSSALSVPLSVTERGFGFLNPLWKVLIGLEFSWSWFFILAFVIYLFLIFLGFNFLSAFEPFFGIRYGSYVKWGLFVVYFVLISSIRISTLLARKFGEYMADKNVWTQSMVIFVLIVFLIFGIIFSSSLRKLSRVVKKEYRTRKLEEKVEDMEDEEKEKEDLERKRVTSRRRERELEIIKKEEEARAREDFGAEE